MRDLRITGDGDYEVLSWWDGDSHHIYVVPNPADIRREHVLHRAIELEGGRLEWWPDAGWSLIEEGAA